MFQKVLHTAELLNELYCRLRSHTRTAWNVVGTVAHQSEHVDHLKRILQTILLAYLLRSEDVEVVGTMLRLEHQHVVAHQLPVVLVESHHVGRQFLVLRSLPGKSTDHVVGLEPLDLQHRNPVSLENLLDIRHGGPDGLGSLLPLGLVERIGNVSESRSLRVERHTDIVGSLLPQNLLQRVHETEDG